MDKQRGASVKKRYYSISDFFRETFGEKIYKIPLALGLPCPNKDGTISTRGCIFCDEYGSGPVASAGLPLREQLNRGIERIRGTRRAQRFIAYFQANTATSGPVEFLRERVKEVLADSRIVGISLGTRPDCLPPDHLDFLADLNRCTHLWVELGLQSILAPSLLFLRRHHTLEDFTRALEALKKRKIRVCTHVILGIPGEGPDQASRTARFLSTLGSDGVKIHPLHVLRRTDLEALFLEKRFTPLTLDEYAELAVTFLEHLSPQVVIQRLSGEREREIFVAPSWALQKGTVLRRIEEVMARRDTWQGKELSR